MYAISNYLKQYNLLLEIYNCEITLDEADEDQDNLLVEIMDFEKRVTQKNQRKKAKRK